ncbi:MAG: hypothetical protein H8E44_32795 [Planctomycetes bacterium]|nr:hypothetical protein [Planctomycetota bacterium]MBL7038724.1 hypothetical protein [Pirellulaceae bacterium]
MNLLLPWRWIRAAIVELSGVALCLLLIGYSQTHRGPQLNAPTVAERNMATQIRHRDSNAQQSHSEELWQMVGVVLEGVLQ